eukprot:7026534-Alexandrium_andersonii.AAC.1
MEHAGISRVMSWARSGACRSLCPLAPAHACSLPRIARAGGAGVDRHAHADAASPLGLRVEPAGVGGNAQHHTAA